MTTFIYYFLPEDKEEQEKLNVFIIYKDFKDVRLSDIKENFPLPGEYYFRFKFDFNKKNVWIDFSNLTSCLPQYQQKVIMKVTRLSWENKKEELSDGFPNI